MPLPPQDDPRRPLHLAIRWIRVLGFVLLIFSLLLLTVMICLAGSWLGAVFVLAFLLAPAAMLFVLADGLKRRKEWAATTGIVLASSVGFFVLLGLITHLSDLPQLISVILLFVVAAMGELIYRLSQSYAAMRLSDNGHVYGFEPILHIDQRRRGRQPAGRRTRKEF